MRKILLPKSLQGITLIGFEDETPEQKTAREAAEAKAKEDDDDDDDGGDDGDKGKEKEDNSGLKSALDKERKARKAAEKLARDAQKIIDDAASKDKSETDQAKDKADKADAKSAKLAERLKVTAVDNVIIKLAGGLKFRDLDDALQLIARGDIEVDQDEDDPSDVTVDEKSVKSALEALAKKKPHLIVAEGQGDRSGSKFNGGKKTEKDVDEEALRKQYPALNRSSHAS